MRKKLHLSYFRSMIYDSGFYDKLVKALHHFLVGVIILSSLYFTFFTSPFEKPDEQLHYFKALSVSKGSFVCKIEENSPVNYIPFENYQFVSKYLTVNQFIYPEENVVNETGSCVLPFPYYLLTGAALSFGSFLGYNVETSFYFGRFINLVFALSVIYIFLRKLSTRSRIIFLFVLSFPMVTYQLSSYSKDVYHFTFGMALYGYLLKSRHLNFTKVSRLLPFVLLTTLFILTRVQYFPFILLILLLPKLRIETRKAQVFLRNVMLLIISSSTIFSVFLIALRNNIYSSPYNENKLLVFHNLIDPQKQLMFIIENPLKYFQTILNSLTSYGVFYVKGIIGILGWLNMPLPNYVYFFYIILGIVVFAVGYKKYNERRKLSVFLVLSLIFIMTFVSNVTLMYLYGSPVGEGLIYGLQGRYFIMLIPLLYFIVTHSFNAKESEYF